MVWLGLSSLWGVGHSGLNFAKIKELEGELNLNTSEPAIDWQIFVPAFGIVTALSLGLIFFPAGASDFTESLTDWVTHNFGWLYMITALGALIFAAWLAFGRFGDIVLGSPGEPPEFSQFSWVAMMFTAGIGAGLVAWGFAESIFYLQTPPFGVEPMSAAAFEWAHMYPIYHWCILPWAIYAVPAVPIAYMLFVDRVPSLKLSKACVSDEHRVGTRKVIDTLVIIGIVGGAATSLGLGVPLVSALTSEFFEVENSVTIKLIVLAVWTAMFGTSTYRGLTRGIKVLADINVVLAIACIVFVLLVGPTVFIIDMTVNSVGLLLDNFFRMSLWLDPIANSGFPETWTVFYWGWWLAYAPMMGLFFGRISRGRTIRQLLIGVIGWGTAGTAFFMSIANGYSLHLELTGAFPVVETLNNSDMSAMVAKILAQLPGEKIVLSVFIILCLIFYATSMDSAAYILASICTEDLKSSQEPARYNRILWALALTAITSGLIVSGGLNTVKSITVLSSIALIPICTLMAVSTYRWLRRREIGL